jgi:hypothetical protein
MFSFAQTAVKVALMPFLLVLYVIAGAVDATDCWWNDMVEWVEADYRE